MNCYFNFEQCSHSGLPFIDTFGALAAKTNADQALYFIPDAQRGGPNPSLWAEINLVNMFENYMDFALDRPRVIGVFPFLWPSGAGHADLLGVRDLSPFVRDRYEEVGACLKSAPPDARRSPLLVGAPPPLLALRAAWTRRDIPGWPR